MGFRKCLSIVKNRSVSEEVDFKKADSPYRNLGHFINYVSMMLVPVYFLNRVSRVSNYVDINSSFHEEVYKEIIDILENPDKHGKDILSEVENKITDPSYLSSFSEMVKKSPKLKQFAVKCLKGCYSSYYDTYESNSDKDIIM